MPVELIMNVNDEDQAIALADDCRYGLSSSVWTTDARRADRLSRRIEAGSVAVNNAVIAAFQLPVPMGGWNRGIERRALTAGEQTNPSGSQPRRTGAARSNEIQRTAG